MISDGGNDSPPANEAAANLQLISVMKNALPDLLDEIEALRKANTECIEEINEMSHNCNEFKGEIEALRKQSAERRELLQLCDQGRAGKIHDPLIDQSIFNLCESRGYGAVMDSAQRQWELKDPVGCFTIGPCLGSVLHALKEINK